jgi:hypothetical protein
MFLPQKCQILELTDILFTLIFEQCVKNHFSNFYLINIYKFTLPGHNKNKKEQMHLSVRKNKSML